MLDWSVFFLHMVIVGRSVYSFLDNKIRPFYTYNGRNVTEAEAVRIRTPTHTDAMLRAAVLRRFNSSNLSDGLTEKPVSQLK
jgi:hypothetical protein